MSHRKILAAGTDYDRGEIIGRAWRDSIITILKSLENATLSKDDMTLQSWLPHARTFLPYIREYAPKTLREMEGVAAGSDLPFEEILLLTCAYEKWYNYHAPEHCTAFAAMGDASKTAELICGQNNDECLNQWAAGQLDAVIHHRSESGMETFIYTHPGIPAYMGMNSAGLCLLWMAIDNGERSPGLPTNALIREVLHFTTLESAVEYIEKVPRSLPNCFLLAHPDEGICSIECSPFFFRPVYSNSTLYHTNHILDGKMAINDKKTDDPASSTVSRYATMGALIEKYYGKIDISLARRMLSDHTRYPESICAHPRPSAVYSKTLASMVFQPEAGSMKIAFGNGCEMPFESYQFSD